MDVLTKIDGSYHLLTKSEQKIAQYVLVNANEIDSLSISLLAAKAEVAETTVIRFCRKLKFKGYQDFKLSLARDLAVRRLRHREDGGETAYPLVADYLDYLKQLSDAVSDDALDQAAKLIDRAHAVCIFGAGVSSIVASYFKTRLVRLGIAVVYDPDIHLQAIDIAVLQADDLLMTISQTGNTQDVLKNVAIAKRLKLKSVCLTNYLNSQLAATADVVLNPPTGSGNDTAEFTPVLGQLVVIDQVCQRLAALNPKRTQAVRERVNQTLINRI